MPDISDTLDPAIEEAVKRAEAIDPLAGLQIHLSLSVPAVNTIFAILGNAPYVQSADIIAILKNQADPQVQLHLAGQEQGA